MIISFLKREREAKSAKIQSTIAAVEKKKNGKRTAESSKCIAKLQKKCEFT